MQLSVVCMVALETSQLWTVSPVPPSNGGALASCVPGECQHRPSGRPLPLSLQCWETSGREGW